MSFLIRSIAVAAAFMAAASPVFSQAPIVDLSSSGNASQGSATPPPPSYPQLASRADASAGRLQGNPQAEAYYQMQVLQQEVQELRGAVEELRHEVKRLRQQRTEDYMDLDRRISKLTGDTPANGAPDSGNAGAGASTSSPQAPVNGAGSGPEASENERDRYQASFGLARNGDYAGAKKAFKSLLEDYPSGQYAPNANYWLGEIALVQGNIEEARTWFVALLDGYPNSSKVWDGRYKLGTVYHQLGDKAKAKELLEQVAASDARAASLAKQYLKENFQ
ncbi:tol-pal system protein YbgF [Microbulbifer hydrolyticus]|uniref:Cell division coordinator CpoB n=1 Tax=Microbulbifer hydrolyticus TaxID=48074 RepID=A0AA89PJX0_9GAMM|nr:tol-pal system protein YbgF [Microbulbifer hydrolyticus]MBB5212826.1 tol-pal system protein YbgF [Microbulbifer hydrolyticus]